MAARRRKGSGRRRGWRSILFFLEGVFRLFIKNIPWLILVLVLAGLVLGIRKFLYADSGLFVQKIVIEPAGVLSPNQLAQLESAVLGKNILKIDLKAIARRLEQNPEIREARIQRIFPFTVRVEIAERKPIAFIHFSPRGSFGLIGDDGFILDIFPKTDSSFPTVEAFGLGIKEPAIGACLKSRGFVEVVRFLKAFSQHPLARRETVSKISLDHLNSISVTFGPGPEIKLGQDPVSHLKNLEKIVYLFEGEGRSGIEYVDLQYGNVIVKRK
ncbi:MAG: FtsQ-type POTRA domain-containing protein [Candidatus Omnitrophica bacterium]|nr:FtsQ-type POTRA domain-containing protein [Candidatus Omnitrophota bacterium]